MSFDMAAVVKLKSWAESLTEDVYRLKNIAEENRHIEYFAAAKLQAWFRGTKTRAYLKILNNNAVIIQKIWRGMLARKYFRYCLKQAVLNMNMNYYNKKATQVQKIWRGYYIRKYVFDYFKRKKYLAALVIKNEKIRKKLEEYADYQANVYKQQMLETEHLRQEYWAHKNHYLVSTAAIPGIYNSPFCLYPDKMEYILRSSKPTSCKQKPKTNEEEFDPACKNYALGIPAKLPPLQNKLQGPFRDPAEVQRQRYKPFKPTLKTETPFNHLEEARKQMKAKEWLLRVHDNPFLPVHKTEDKYEPMIFGNTQYCHFPYGTKHFREECIDKHISKQPYQRYLPPIHLFDQMTDTYSQS